MRMESLQPTAVFYVEYLIHYGIPYAVLTPNT